MFQHGSLHHPHVLHALSLSSSESVFVRQGGSSVAPLSAVSAEVVPPAAGFYPRLVVHGWDSNLRWGIVPFRFGFAFLVWRTVSMPSMLRRRCKWFLLRKTLGDMDVEWTKCPQVLLAFNGGNI